MYRAAIGHDNAAALQDLVVQPRSIRLVPGRLVYAASGLVYEDGGSTTRLIFDALTWPQYSALLGQFGLASARSALVTLRLRRDSDNSFQTYNATIVRPVFDENAEAALGVLLNVEFEVLRATPA